MTRAESEDRRPARKVCPNCKTDKSRDDYYSKNRDGRIYLQSWCKSCSRARELSTYSRRSELRKFGVNEEWYAEKLRFQHGGCAICAAPKANRTDDRRLAVDHDHDTGRPRGLLCTPCNRAIGMLQDDPDRVLAIYLYLMHHEDRSSAVTDLLPA